MKANKKAITVAKDVLAHLGALHLKPGRYLHLKKADKHLCQLDGELQEHADKIQEKCEVCLLGACVLSKARIYDALDMDTFWSLEGCCDERKMRCSLEKVFDNKTMDLMEAAFEKSSFYWMTSAYSSEIEAAIAFGKRYRSIRKRVRAVMENIIANKGYFKPEKAEVKV